MKNYELLYILPASQTSEEIVKNFNDVKKHIEKLGGTMLETLLEHPFLTKTGMSKDEEPEEIKAIPIVKRKLAYPVKHEKFGIYCLVNFQSEGKKIQDIDEYLRLNANVLRHIIIEADPMTKDQLELLQTLFARKKAEKDKEEADKESSKPKEEAKRPVRRTETPAEEQKPAEEVNKEEKEEAAQEEPVKEEKTEIAKEEKPKAEEEKKNSKKSKIKLEELEDKLDEILEDTIV